LRTLLRDRDQWVRMRTQLQHTLQAIAPNHALRRGRSLWTAIKLPRKELRKSPQAKICHTVSRGEKAFGIFVIFSGNVRLDFGNDASIGRCYGPGALVGLPATLTKRAYSTTATVAEDAELGFLRPQVLESMIRENPDLCRELLTILSERMFEIQQLQETLLRCEKQPFRESLGALPEDHHG
jgi:CRP-like cAMP-binding protein